MRDKKKLYFSKKILFREIDWDDKENLICQIKDRIFEFYLDPAKALGELDYGFGQCVLLCTVLEFLASFENEEGKSKGKHFQQVVQRIHGFDSKKSRRFWRNYRNGLVHEGYIKGLDQLSFTQKEVVSLEQNIMVVNPQILHKKIEFLVYQFVSLITTEQEQYTSFLRIMKKKFAEDVDRSKRIH